jgi:MoaA/NifB/PqqE/SkfB family radical SAM enzyme
MGGSLEILHIMPGLLCNFQCTHCVNDSGPNRSEKMDSAQVENVFREVRERGPKRLVFTGGEPTLHIDIINRLIEAHPDQNSLEVFMTTNGWYSKNAQTLKLTLDKIRKLTHLQLSYDIYHGTKVTTEDIFRLRDEVRGRGVEFNISVCITSPQELIQANRLQKELSELVIFQRVDAVGRAKTNQLQFKYPDFEPEVLNRKCPNLGQMSFIVNKGFSVCCSNLAFNPSPPQEVFHESIDSHMQSEFYRNLETKTFGQMLKEKGISPSNLGPDFSSPCRICELAHQGNQI